VYNLRDEIIPNIYLSAPLFSIIIPTYNGEKTILFVLESIKQQNFKDFEVIIYDDASKDGTKKLIKKWNTNFGGDLIFIEGKKNYGSFFAANKCIQIAKGRFIITGAQDNIFSNDRLMVISNIIERNTSLNFITSDVFTGNFEYFLKHRGDLKKGLSHFVKPNLYSLLLLRSLYFQFDNLVVHKDLAALFYKSSAYSPCEDLSFIINVFFKHNEIALHSMHIDAPLLYKISSDSSQTFNNAENICEVTIRIAKEFSKNFFFLASINGSSKIIYFVRKWKLICLFKFFLKEPIKFILGFFIIILRVVMQLLLTKKNQELDKTFF